MEERGLIVGRSRSALLGAIAAAGVLAACLGEAPPARRSPLAAASVADIESALHDLRGAPVLLNFWAVWCDPCVEELPDLAGIEARFSKSGVRLLGVSCDLFVEDDTPSLRKKVIATLDHAGVRYPNLLYAGAEDPLTEAFDLPGPIPYSILYGPDGRERRRWTGRLPLGELESALAELPAGA